MCLPPASSSSTPSSSSSSSSQFPSSSSSHPVFHPPATSSPPHPARPSPPAFSSLPPFLLFFFLLLQLLSLLTTVQCLVSFFSPDDLKYTFGVDRLVNVPAHSLVYPRLVPRTRPVPSPDAPLFDLFLDLSPSSPSSPSLALPLHSVTAQLLADQLVIVRRTRPDGGGSLEHYRDPAAGALVQDCHFQHRSEHAMAAISNCDDGELKGTILYNGTIHVLHPIPVRHMARVRRSSDGQALHVLYKRAPMEEGGGQCQKSEEFCGIENTISSEELVEEEAGVHEDMFVVGQRLSQEGDLVVELGVFVDEQLWRHFSSKYGSLAWQKLQQYALTMLSNIQLMYRQPTAVPQLTFRVVRYEVYQTQPSAIAAYLHENGNAQRYLDMFCRYQRSLGTRDWDHALMLTGFDIHRGYGANSISGIARLDGMCDPWNTCTLAEGLDFTSAFIGTHELGHSVGMRHDEPYCAPTYIMSSSLGPGKVTWSTCSMRDYQTFIQRMDGRRTNCLRTSLLREKLPLTDSLKPGQIYDAHEQCRLMHGPTYIQVSPRQDHYDGICHMIWCGQGTYGRIVTSHPALEGTFCGPSQWCSLGRCVPWTGFGAPLAPRPPVQGPALPIPTPAPPAPTPAPTPRIDGQWSAWSAFDCQHCSCSGIIGAIGITISQRTCSNPAPLNGGAECSGQSQRAAVCARKCQNERETVNQHITNLCTEHKRTRNDPELTGTGSQLSRFPARACKVFCDVQNGFGGRNYRFYGDNLPDGAPCGWDRYCLNGECTELNCDDSMLALLGDTSATAACPTAQERCPLSPTNYPAAALPVPNDVARGQWSQWSLWSDCTVSCGDTGVQLRERTCSIPNRCEGEPSQSQACGRTPCPSTTSSNEPQWSEWTPWNQCSVSCGRGSQARYRRCTSAQNTLAYTCQGRTMDIRYCDELPCGTITTTPRTSGDTATDTYGQWSEWSAWSTCSSNCGPGSSVRIRACSRLPCDGTSQQRLACNLRECTSSTWNQWGAWSECSRLCGKGTRTRSRTCPAGANCAGQSVDQQSCNEQPCGQSASQNAQWSGWSPWGSCSTSCGNGVKRRMRHCQPQGMCPGSYIESAICNDAPCAVSDANWGGWGYWSPCSVSCGNGVRRRVRKCYGSGACAGGDTERETCWAGRNC